MTTTQDNGETFEIGPPVTEADLIHMDEVLARRKEALGQAAFPDPDRIVVVPDEMLRPYDGQTFEQRLIKLLRGW